MSFRTRFILSHVAIAFVIVASASTAVVALRSATRQTELGETIDGRLAMIEQLRASTREVAMSARRYVLSGDGKEHQRVLAISDEVSALRQQLHVRSFSPQGGLLEGQLDTYLAAVVFGMTIDEEQETLARLSRFEDELVRVRVPLVETFDRIVSRERTKRDTSMSARTLATAAQWGVIFASALGVVLTIGCVTMVLRRLDRGGVAVRSQPIETAAGSEPRLLS